MLREDQIERYARHILLREVGGKGQERLLAASVAIQGLDAAGIWAATWLALAGVGRLHLLDPRPVEPGLPLPLIEAKEAGRRRDRSLAEAIPAHNPDVRCLWGEAALPEDQGPRARLLVGTEGGELSGATAPTLWIAAGAKVLAMGWVEEAAPCAACAGLPEEAAQGATAARAGSMAASRLLALLLGLEEAAPGFQRWEGHRSHSIPPCTHR